MNMIIGNDKQTTLNHRYEEHSMWLSNQFDLIRCLIQTNPRDQLVISEKEASTRVSGSAQGNIIIKNDADNAIGVIGQKRKSFEGHKYSTGESPNMKRNSSELAVILEEQGLPSDLQKLRKDQLVAELEKRGILL
jgi:hypothetical protein